MMIRKSLFRIIVFVSIFTGVLDISAQRVTTHENEDDAKKSAGNGVTFKIPDKVMPMKWTDFKEMLMLSEKLPSGVFITYPNENESIADLKTRAESVIARMFVRDEKKIEEIVWESKTVPSHIGDSGDTATMRIFDNEEQTLQITIYDREWNGIKFIYGYFARKNNTSKNRDDSAEFLDDKGSGVKVFDKFWKSFPDK